MTPIPNAGPALAFQSVSKAYGTTVALEDFTLEVERGELFGLVGGNGAGKTTLIKCLLDFTDTDRGEIRIFGVPHGVTASRREHPALERQAEAHEIARQQIAHAREPAVRIPQPRQRHEQRPRCRAASARAR